jgi:hypothetical protein
MKHRLNAHHSNEGINISSKRCVTSAVARHWRQDIGGKALVPIHWCQDIAARHARRTAQAPAITHLLFVVIVADWSTPTRQGRLVKADASPSFFVGGLCVYLFPRIGGRPIGRGPRPFALLVSN